MWSYIIEAENKANPFEERTNAIADWKKQAIVKIKENKLILDKAKYLKESDYAVRMPYTYPALYLPDATIF